MIYYNWKGSLLGHFAKGTALFPEVDYNANATPLRTTHALLDGVDQVRFAAFDGLR
jgi:hypothetical protein